MPDTVTKITPNCPSFSWDWKETEPTTLINVALKEHGGDAYHIKTGYDHYMIIIAPSEEWADKFQIEWDKVMGEEGTPDPEYIITEEVERGEVFKIDNDPADDPF